MSVKPIELVTQSANGIFRLCVCVCVCCCMCVCVCVRMHMLVKQSVSILTAMSHAGRGSVSGDPAMRTRDYPSMHDSYI